MASDDEVALMDQLAAIANLDAHNNKQTLYIAALSGSVSEDKSNSFYALADDVLSKVRSS
jgi:hypothetical protein